MDGKEGKEPETVRAKYNSILLHTHCPSVSQPVAFSENLQDCEKVSVECCQTSLVAAITNKQQQQQSDWESAAIQPVSRTMTNIEPTRQSNQSPRPPAPHDPGLALSLSLHLALHSAPLTCNINVSIAGKIAPPHVVKIPQTRLSL